MEQGREKETRIPLQIGTEIRIKRNGELRTSNPELEIAEDDKAVEAVVGYRFDSGSKEHVIRLLQPGQ